MKIIAQSEVPTTLPFMHIAYIAAQTHSERFVGGSFILAAAAVAFYVVQKKSTWVKYCVAGVALVLFVGLMAYPFPPHYTFPDKMTQARAQNLIQAITKAQYYGKEVSTDVRQWTSDPEIEKDDILDGWNREFRIIKRVQDGEVRYSVVSAGKDGKFGTRDDIIKSDERYRDVLKKH